jgi:hypothetical protein
VAAIADAVRWAEEIMKMIDERCFALRIKGRKEGRISRKDVEETNPGCG